MTSGTLKDRVYAAVLFDVINGEYTVDSVISEKKLSERMQMSKAPVREALIELCAQGILRSVPRQGYVVVRYTERNIEEMLQYRMILECGSLEDCFDRITPTQLRRLESVVESEFLFLARNDTKDFWSHTFNFHLTLVSFSENEFVYDRLSSALNACMRAYLQLYWKKDQEDFPAPPVLHREIVESIRQGDKARTLEMLRRDICSLYGFHQIAKESRNDG